MVLGKFRRKGIHLEKDGKLEDELNVAASSYSMEDFQITLGLKRCCEIKQIFSNPRKIGKGLNTVARFELQNLQSFPGTHYHAILPIQHTKIMHRNKIVMH